MRSLLLANIPFFGMKKETKNNAKTLRLEPLGDKVLIKPLGEEELGAKSPSGIIIPDTIDREKADRGRVIAAGPGKWNEDGDKRVPLGVKEGDKVIFQWGDKIEFGGETYYLVSESNISAIIK